MKWEMLAAIGQLAAVLVGIPSLIYLAVQIRAQTHETRPIGCKRFDGAVGDLTNSLHNSAEFSAIYLRGMQLFGDLDPVSSDLARFSLPSFSISRECISPGETAWSVHHCGPRSSGQ